MKTEAYIDKAIEVAERMMMTERIAMVLDPHLFTSDPHHGVLGSCNYCADSREELRAKAVQILEVMRSPTLEMRKVCSFEEAEVTWPAMIDAAIARVRKEL